MAAPAGRRKMNIVVEGCCHGELPAIYASVLKMEQVGALIVLLVFVFVCSRGAWKPSRNFLTECPQ
ncbi:unnamed protein product [Ectocarpus sp. 12 AP-2014]